MSERDWIQNLAIELADMPGPLRDDTSAMRAIIIKHCPFVAYMRVPRCETCAHWTAGEAGKYGDCSWLRGYLKNAIEVTPANFGCVQWKEKA